MYPHEHGVSVTLPGGHRCEAYTATNDDAETIRDILRHSRYQAALFDFTPTIEGTYSR